jgi:regulatory protein
MAWQRKRPLAPEAQALDKLRSAAWRRCAAREWAPRQVATWLREQGADPEQVALLLEELETEGFLDPGRYARAFVNDKHRLRAWGRLRIQQQLRSDGISDSDIAAALAALDPDEYQAQLQQVLRRKLRELGLEAEQAQISAENVAKVYRYAAYKGYEHDLTRTALATLLHMHPETDSDTAHPAPTD